MALAPPRMMIAAIAMTVSGHSHFAGQGDTVSLRDVHTNADP
jgi:hypothetical protein